MAKTKAQKKEILSQYEQYLKGAKAVYLASTKLNANESNELKKKLKAQNAIFSVVKNTIFTIAAKNVLGEDIDLQGPVAVISSNGDVVEAAKLIAALKKEKKADYVLTILDGKVMEGSQIEALSRLESREQLLGKLVFLVNYPTTGLARALANNVQKLMYALNAVKDSKN
jgi:large subunit ribosomal protein L10